MQDIHQPALRHLGMLRKGESAVVTGLSETANSEDDTIRTRLLELGFSPGEAVRVVAEAFPQHDPIAVRIGNTTFALRRREAVLVRIAENGSVAL